MISLMSKQKFASLKFEGRSYDCGSKYGFLSANIAFGMDDPKLADDLLPFMRDIVEGQRQVAAE